MSSESVLIFDDQTISMPQVFRYLRDSGKLDGFIGDLARQFVIERSLQQENLAVNPTTVEQAIIDFRLQQQLTGSEKFQTWLQENNLTFEMFYSQIANNFRFQQLKETHTSDQIEGYFVERKSYLNRAVISRLIVDNAELADELKSQLDESATFEQLVRDYSITDDRVMNGMMGPIPLARIPEALREKVEPATPGSLVGPLEIESRWGIFRVEGFLNASLEDPQTRQTLQDELFERWVSEQVKQLPIQIQLGDSQPPEPSDDQQ
ncbi:MAG: peptidylprolyl isomerase [Cyanobacteria bacterium J06638_22]